MVSTVKKLFILLSKNNSLDSTAMFPQSSPIKTRTININIYNRFGSNLMLFLI